MVDLDKAVIARLKKEGKVFEIFVDCDNALKFKEGSNRSLDDVLATMKIFSDAKKGLAPTDAEMQSAFGTIKAEEVAKQIIKKGEIQITSEHRSRLRDKKKKQIIQMIHINGIDPKTNLPHPITRLELAFDEAKIKIDEYKKPEEQIDGIIKDLRPIIPIRVEKRHIAIRLPPNFAGKAYSIVSGYGKIIKEDWLNDGSWSGIVVIPAGLQAELFDKLNNLTHSEVSAEIIKTE